MTIVRPWYNIRFFSGKNIISAKDKMRGVIEFILNIKISHSSTDTGIDADCAKLKLLLCLSGFYAFICRLLNAKTQKKPKNLKRWCLKQYMRSKMGTAAVTTISQYISRYDSSSSEECHCHWIALFAFDTAPFGHYQVSGEYKNAQKKDIWKESEEEQMLYLTFWCWNQICK